VLPDEVLDDPALEGRARELSKVIRCVVCQNESIDSSNADLARDLRILVRERLVAGDSDEAVLDFLVARYGEFVLLRPRVRPGTYFLWYGPAALLLLGGLGVALYFRRRRREGAPVAAQLNPEEQARLARLLAEKQDTD
jgi:cytochrome c-type biogenesis protein CcmH